MSNSRKILNGPALLFLALALSALLTIPTREHEADPKPKLQLDFGKQISATVRYQGCSHNETKEVLWKFDGAGFRSGKAKLSQEQLKALRLALVESRDDTELLLQFEGEVDSELVAKNMRKLLPWIPSSPPRVSKEKLRKDAEEFLLSEPIGCTSTIDTSIVFDGEPRVTLHLNRAELESDAFIGGLPSWSVSVGKENWKTKSPRLSTALSPLIAESGDFADILEWPERYLIYKAGELGSQWCESYIKEWILGEFGDAYSLDKMRIETRGGGFGWLRFGVKELHLVSVTELVFEPNTDPREKIRLIFERLRLAEELLTRQVWLESILENCEVHLEDEGHLFAKEWTNLKFKGIPAFRYTLRNNGRRLSTILADLVDERVVILRPSKAILEALHISAAPGPQEALLVQPGGTAKIVNWQ